MTTGSTANAAAAALLQFLRDRGDDAGAGGGERMAGGQGRAVDVQPGPVDAAERGVQPQPLLAVLLGLPGGQGGQHGHEFLAGRAGLQAPPRVFGIEDVKVLVLKRGSLVRHPSPAAGVGQFLGHGVSGVTGEP